MWASGSSDTAECMQEVALETLSCVVMLFFKNIVLVYLTWHKLINKVYKMYTVNSAVSTPREGCISVVIITA